MPLERPPRTSQCAEVRCASLNDSGDSKLRLDFPAAAVGSGSQLPPSAPFAPASWILDLRPEPYPMLD